MRKFHSESMSNTELTFPLPKGSYGGIWLVYRGTNPAVAKTRANLGTAQLSVEGKPIIDVNVDLLSYLTDLKGGLSTFTSVDAGALYAICFIPFGKPRDNNNVYVFSDNQRAYLKLQFPALSDVVSGIIDIYLEPKDGVQNYFFALTSRFVSVAGATTMADVHQVPNICSVYLLGTSVIDEVQLVKDGQLLINADKAALQAWSDWNNEVETTNTLIEADLNPSKNLSEVVANEIDFTYKFNALGTLQQYFAYVIFTPQQAIKSVVVLQQKIQNRSAVTKTPIIDMRRMPPVTVTGSGTIKGGGSQLGVINSSEVTAY